MRGYYARRSGAGFLGLLRRSEINALNRSEKYFLPQHLVVDIGAGTASPDSVAGGKDTEELKAHGRWRSDAIKACLTASLDIKLNEQPSM